MRGTGTRARPFPSRPNKNQSAKSKLIRMLPRGDCANAMLLGASYGRRWPNVLYLVRWLRTFQGHIRACRTSPPASAAVGASTACACSHEVRLCCAGGQGRAPRRLPVPASAVLRTRQLCVRARARVCVCACACMRFRVAGGREGAQDRARACIVWRCVWESPACCISHRYTCMRILFIAPYVRHHRCPAGRMAHHLQCGLLQLRPVTCRLQVAEESSDLGPVRCDAPADARRGVTRQGLGSRGGLGYRIPVGTIP